MATTILLWTPYDPIQVTLSVNEGEDIYRLVRIKYQGLVAFGLVLLIMEFFFMMVNGFEISFLTTIHIGLDLAGFFFGNGSHAMAL